MRRIFRLILILLLGYYITEWWLNQKHKSTSSEKVPSPTQKTPVPTSTRASDPLTELNGIGPTFEHALNAIGIRTFAQLADQDADNLANQLTGVRVTALRIKKDRWIEQAADRAKLTESLSTRWSANDGKST